MARSNISIVREAIEIQGYITVSVGHRDEKCRKIDVVDGEWVTDITTSDLCGYVRIRKTKDAVIRQAKYIIEHAAEIRAKRAAVEQAAVNWARNN